MGWATLLPYLCPHIRFLAVSACLSPAQPHVALVHRKICFWLAGSLWFIHFRQDRFLSMPCLERYEPAFATRFLALTGTFGDREIARRSACPASPLLFFSHFSASVSTTQYSSESDNAQRGPAGA